MPLRVLNDDCCTKPIGGRRASRAYDIHPHVSDDMVSFACPSATGNLPAMRRQEEPISTAPSFPGIPLTTPTSTTRPPFITEQSALCGNRCKHFIVCNTETKGSSRGKLPFMRSPLQRNCRGVGRCPHALISLFELSAASLLPPCLAQRLTDRREQILDDPPPPGLDLGLQ